ncbi:cupin domain-containing protein [Nocardia sp. NBC_00881]|uniref:cupin domain-containing protein n=1 Tax=Nocardia sp. NBC_00881 TaxID=2975995 RepID=UPI0038641971|nr:cupin domain-containing protein [Nocardia sp. NBC_00881]
MKSAVKRVRVIGPSDSAEKIGRQRQRLTPCVTKETCGASGISAGMVNMAPGAMSKAHYHAHTEIIVVCLRGTAVTLIGPELTPHFHGPGEFIYIPEGVVHVAVNLDEAEDLVAVEMRTDPLFNDDVVLAPEHDVDVPDVVARLRRRHPIGS